jgi:NAD-reducing hydrogenase small subunit
MSEKKTLATVWLDGCSGCHMSLLDMDERLIELSQQFELVYSPLVDQKIFPPQVDITLVEGAIGNEDDLEKIHLIRERTHLLVSLGDCAVTGNVSALRNPFGAEAVLHRVYRDNAAAPAQTPSTELPKLLNSVLPLHNYVHVDVFVPGCPPSADTIYTVLSELLAGRMPDLNGVARFG